MNKMTNTKHIHADNMMAYSQDAMTNDRPFELWEVEYEDGYGTSGPCIRHPSWNLHAKYRRKQKTLKIGEFEVPEPVRKPLNVGDSYYIADLAEEFNYEYYWNNDKEDNEWLENGLIHLSKENAELHRQALLSFTKLGYKNE